MGRGEADKWLLHGNVWLLYGASWLWVIALLSLSVDWGNCCLSESGWRMVMQSAQSWNGWRGRLRSHHSPQVFLLGSTLCDTMCFNLSVFECVHSLLYMCANMNLCLFALCWSIQPIYYLLMLTPMHASVSQLQSLHMFVRRSKVYLSVCRSQQCLHKCFRCNRHNSLKPNGLRLLNLCAADPW